jgi:hypothetical protein
METQELGERLAPFCQEKYGDPDARVVEVVTMPGHAGFAYGFRVETGGRTDSWFIRLPPPNVNWRGTADVLRQVADGLGLSFHDLHVNAEEDGSFSVELHLEMRPDISLLEAHALADDFERRVAEGATRPFRLIAHLEPVPDDVLHPAPDLPQSIRDRIRDLILKRTGDGRLQELQTYRLGMRVGVTASISIRKDASLSEAHDL